GWSGPKIDQGGEVGAGVGAGVPLSPLPLVDGAAGVDGWAGGLPEAGWRWPAWAGAVVPGRAGCVPELPLAGLAVPASGAWGCWPGVVPASIAAWAEARLRATCSKKPS